MSEFTRTESERQGREGEREDSQCYAYEDYKATLFPSSETADEVFLQYFSFPPGERERRIVQVSYRRAQFSVLVRRAIALMLSLGIGKGERVLMHVSANRVEDLVLRAAATVLGFVPVTVNWQADELTQVLYKLEVTEAKAVVYDYQSQGIADLRIAFPSVLFVHTNDVLSHPPLGGERDGEGERELERLIAVRASQGQLPLLRDTRCIIFTSGTTGKPKGVSLSYANYRTNRRTFESFLDLSSPGRRLQAIVVNPLHHTNSTSITDWALRREASMPTSLSLLERYTSDYWAIVCASVLNMSIDEVAALSLSFSPSSSQSLSLSLPDAKERAVVLPLVSRHIDFLDALCTEREGERERACALPIVTPSLLSLCLSRCVLLLGSAPVGPSTVSRIQRLSLSLPTVRFGSTETTLQVCGIPVQRERESVMQAFTKGWTHRCVTHRESEGETEGEGQTEGEGEREEVCGGYYIGQDHPPFTEVNVVRSVDKSSPLYLQECLEGESGYLITRGGHVMSGYVNATQAQTDKALDPDLGWYLGLGDIGFYLRSDWNARKDFYWQTRDSQMLIRGGANYSYEQINAELSRFLQRVFSLSPEDFRLAVCGVKCASEHEDDLCVCIELVTERGRERESALREGFLSQARVSVSKGAKPDHVYLGAIPMVASKGVVNVPEMERAWKQRLLSHK